MTRRFLGRFLLLLALFFVLKKSLDFTFGWILAEVFARGTGCEVDLKNPQLHFFPLSASIDDALIRHRSEPLEAGFRAEHISIRLHFSELFHRELLLSDLELRGTSALSDGTDTGFIQTFAFLFPPKDPNAPPPAPPSRFVGWLKDWTFHITTIRISTADAANQLVIGFHDQSYLWDKVDVDFVEQNSDPKKPYDLKASGENFRFRGSALPELPLGRLAGSGEIGLGQLVLADASIGSSEPDGAISEVTAQGLIRLGAPGEYSISVQSELHKEYLQHALTALISRAQNIPERLRFGAELRGTFLAPEITGRAALDFGPGALLPARENCGIRSIETSYRLGVDGLHFSDLAIEDLVDKGEAMIGFSGTNAVSASLSLSLDRNKRWIQSCFLSGVAGENPALQQAAVDSLADSQTSVTVAGTLKPFDVRGTVESELSMESHAMQSKLNSEFHVTDVALDLKLQERGVVPQIQPTPAPLPGEAGASKTEFRRALNSNIDVELRYGFNNHLLELSRMNIVRYPTERMFARLGPFLGDSTYRALLNLSPVNSLIDLDLRGETNFHDRAALSGKMVATNIAPFNIPFDRIALEVTANDKEFSLKNLTADVLGGSVRGSMSYAMAEHAVKGGLTAAGVQLENLPPLHATLPDIHSVLSGGVNFSGTAETLAYEGTIDVASSHGGEAAATRRSEFDISGDSQAMRIKGTVLDAANRVNILFPISTDEKAVFQLDVQLREFPLDYFFAAPPPKEGEAEQMQGGLSGTLHYQGPYHSPLLGEGSVQFERLWLTGRGMSLEQAGNLQASIANGRLTFTNVRVISSGRELALTGFIDHQSGWDAHLNGRWELASFLRRVDMLEQTTGQVDLDLHINGPSGTPIISGPVKLNDASISFPLGNTIVGISELNAVANFNRHDLDLTSIEGRIGGAKLTGTALITNIVGPGSVGLESSFSFQRVTVEPIDHLTLELDGDLALRTGTEHPLELAGDLFIRSGQYENIIKLTQVLRALTRVVIGSESAPNPRSRGQSGVAFSDLAFDLNIRAPGGFLLDTNFAQAEMRSDLQLTGTASQPLLNGKIEAIEGSFGLQSQEFELLNAEAAFFSRTNSLDPRISLVGETKVIARNGEEHHVRLLVTGTLTNPKVNFSSDSGLRREEIQSLVGLGANFEALDFLHGGRRTRTVAEIISPSSGVSFEERLRSLTKFETVRIDTALSPATGEFVPRVVAKRPMFRKVNLDIQSELGGRRSSSAELEYELTPYLSLIGGWRSGSLRREVDQSSGQVGGGIHYRSTFPGFRLFSPQLSGLAEDPKK